MKRLIFVTGLGSGCGIISKQNV